MNHKLTLPATYPVACHTQHVGHGTTFVAIKGMKENGIRYVPEALAKGASRIVIEQTEQLSAELQACIEKHQAQLITVENARQALAQLSASALQYPATKLKIIGITGTKGKSTTTFLVEHFLKTAGYKTALLSTVRNHILTDEFPTTLTTQQPDYLHLFLNACVNAGVEWVVMEVAAQALSLHRIEGITFDALVYTNFSQEHAEFYPSIAHYFQAKKALLTHAKPFAPIIVNADDEWLQQLAALNTMRFFSQKDIVIHSSSQGISAEMGNISLHCPALIGTYNMLNIYAAAVCVTQIGVPWQTVQGATQTFPGVPGRLEKYTLPNGAFGIIDYAHNPSSYEAVLGTLRTLTDHLIVVFGCGGERDATKRPLMGEIAARIADVVLITSDNPRSEDPATIARDICQGIPTSAQHKITLELDREQAIKKAYSYSRKNSMVVLLGKGPDEYQLIQGTKYPFSEKSILLSLS